MTPLSALRVLLATPRYAPYVGGVETHTREVGRRLAALGHAVTVLTADPGGNLPPTEEAEGVRIVRVPAWPKQGDYYVAPGIYRRIAEGEWDIVHCQGFHTFVPPLAMLAARRSRTPYLLSFHSGGHSSTLRNAIRPAQAIALRPLLAHAACLIGVSQFEAAQFQRWLRLPADRFTVVPNGSSLPQIPVPAPADGGRKLILSVGRLERYKGHHRVIAALPHVLAFYPNARLEVIGSGPYEPELRALVAELGLGKIVTIRSIAGNDRNAMAEVVAQADLVTLMSDYEAHPISVMEALALKRPVLAAYTSGLAELADDGLVRAVPSNSSDEVVAAEIVDLLRNPPPAIDVTLPNWDECTARLQEIYRDAVGRRSCAS